MAEQFVQGGIFGGLNFQPLEGFNDPWGTAPAVKPSISPVEGLPGSLPFSGVRSGGSAAGTDSVAPAGGTHGSLPLPNAASAPPNSSQPASGGSTGLFGLPSDWFYRAVLIILGFIFVAVGLHLFAPGVVPDVRRVVR